MNEAQKGAGIFANIKSTAAIELIWFDDYKSIRIKPYMHSMG